MRIASVLVLAAVLAAGGVVGWLVARGTASEETVTETVTAAARARGLPAAVETTRAALLAAAVSGDYERLRPLETPAAALKMPYVLSRGLYVWPWAYTIESAADLSVHERALLAALEPLATLFPADSGYLGWRAGIEPDGDWAFFVASD